MPIWVGGTQTIVALKMVEADEMLSCDFDGPGNWLPDAFACQYGGHFEVRLRSQWDIPERVVAMGREWAQEPSTATIKKADDAFV